MICLVVALKAEARPLIDAFGLIMHKPRGLFPVYGNGPMRLVITGIGKSAASAATAYLHAIIGKQTNLFWLNVGIAGHPTRAIGESVFATKVVDVGSGRAWWLREIPGYHTQTDRLLTVDQPEENYNENAMYDMEAAGFYGIAVRCASAGRVQCYKIISDNRIINTKQLNANIIRELISDNIQVIRNAVKLSQISHPDCEISWDLLENRI